MVQIEQKGEGIHLRHQTATLGAIGVWIWLIIIFSCLIGAPLMAFLTWFSPRTIVIECQREKQQCTQSKQWLWLPRYSFPLSRLNELYVSHSEKGEALALDVKGKRSNWSMPVDSADQKKALEQGVDRLRQFANGNDPFLSVGIPTGRPSL